MISSKNVKATCRKETIFETFGLTFKERWSTTITHLANEMHILPQHNKCGSSCLLLGWSLFSVIYSHIPLLFHSGDQQVPEGHIFQ